MSTINQEQLGELLSAYLDGETTATETRLVEETLRADAAARQLLEDLRNTAGMVASLPKHAAPPDTLESIEAQLERSALIHDTPDSTTTTAPGRSPWMAALSVAAVLGFAVLGGLWIMRDGTLFPGADTSTTRLAERAALDASDAAESTTLRTPGQRLARASANEKLAAGLTPLDLRTHDFSNEALRLHVVVENESQRTALMKRFGTQLNRRQVAPVEQVSSAAATRGFYLQGQSPLNHDPEAGTQWLVHLPTDEVESWVAELADEPEVEGRVALAAGPIVFQGLPETQQALHRMQNVIVPDDALASDAGARPSRGSSRRGVRDPSRTESIVADTRHEVPTRGDEPLNDLFTAIGLDPALITALTSAAPQTTDEDATAGAGTHAAESGEPTSAASSDAAAPTGPPTVGESLVERRKRELHLRLSADTERQDAQPPGAAPLPEDVPYVTLVVELRVAAKPDKPTTSEPKPRPPTPARSRANDSQLR